VAQGGQQLEDDAGIVNYDGKQLPMDKDRRTKTSNLFFIISKVIQLSGWTKIRLNFLLCYSDPGQGSRLLKGLQSLDRAATPNRELCCAHRELQALVFTLGGSQQAPGKLIYPSCGCHRVGWAASRQWT